MQNQDKTSFDTPVIHWAIIGIGILVSFIDMLLLSGALESLLETDQMTASVYALGFALIGTGSAFLWGRAKALHPERRWFYFHELWVWLAFCLIFIAIRAIVIIKDVTEYPDEIFTIISSEALMAVLLTVLYIGTGLIVKTEARKIFDPRLYSEWKNMRAAKNVQNTIAKKYAEAERMVIELEKFQKYYYSLEKQYIIHKNSLADAERATLSSVVRRVLEDNPHLSPQVVEDILQSILTERQNRL